MAYKSLLTVLTDPESVAQTLDAAVALAAREDAHLDILALGVDRSQMGYSYIGGAAMLAQVSMERAEADAAAVNAAVRAVMDRQDIRWAAEVAIAQIGGLGALVALKARFSDLVVQPRPYGKSRVPEAEAVVEAALFEGQAPVLVLPEAGLAALGGKRVVVAWNQSREALTAVRRAMPFLIAADLVNVVVIDPPNYGPERSDPGGALCQMLVRHGIKAEVSVLAKTMPRISDLLARHVRDQGADLLVMGAYGHSRLRESIIGGATRNALEQAEVPVLMAH